MAASYVNLSIDGQLVTNVILKDICVTRELNHHGWCQISCRHTEDQRLPALVGALVEGATGDQAAITAEHWLGKRTQILAVDQGLVEHTLFEGFVLEVDLEYEIWGSFAVTLTAVTESFKMDQTPRHSYYTAKTLADVAQQVAANSGLDVKVNCAPRKALNYAQWGETDFQFLRRIVDDYGAWMRPTANGLEIYDAFQPGATLHWRATSGDDSLRSFIVKGRLVTPSFNGAHYNFHEMQSQVYNQVSGDTQFFDSAGSMVDAVKLGSKDNMPPGYVHQRARAMTLDEFNQRLKKESVRSLGSSVNGYGESQDMEILPGNTVNIGGNLDAQGVYGVTHVTHHWDAQRYSNKFKCTPWKNYTEPQPPEMQSWLGVVPARVVEHNDPKKMGRIKVQYFWQEGGPAHWARMITPHAGASRGFMFMPEVGDEVAVAFEDGDLERPYILGCVWNGVDQAPRQEFWGDDVEPNDVKRIMTKSGNRIQLVDKPGKESIAMATPKYLKISMIENTDETSRSMITVHSENGDIFLSAPNGRIHLRGKYISREIG
ncbi:MAG: phage baseplate assembly protein V [Terriglobia bacterium]